MKNIPSYVNEKRLRDHFAACGEVTDCRIQKVKDGDKNELLEGGKSRGFCFIGFKEAAEAQKCVKQMRNTYFDTHKIMVEIARPIGSKDITRPWSKYSFGSSANKRLNPDLYAAEEEEWRQKKKARRENKAKKGAASKDENNAQVTEYLQMGKMKKKEQIVGPLAAIAALAGTSEGKGDGNGIQNMNENEDKENKVNNRTDAFDDSLSDLAYLKQKKDKSLAEYQTEDDQKPGIELKIGTAGAKSSTTPVEDATNTTSRREVIEGQKEVEGSGRLYVTNLPYVATEEEVKKFFEKHGPVASVKICNSEDTLKSRGFCYVTYMFPEHALKVLSSMDLPEFQGRLLRIQPAKDLPSKEGEAEAASTNGWGSAGSSYKQKKEKHKKDVEAHSERTWNLLYMSSVTANTAMATKLGIEKRELMKRDEGNLAVTQALAETHIIQETKQWLEREGIRVEAFTRKGASLSTCSVDATKARRNDTIIVKHLPPDVDGGKLRERFGRYGELMRCAIAPSKTVAVVQYTSAGEAEAAFKKQAFARFLHVPLYLEWAPEEIFIDPTRREAMKAEVEKEEQKEIQEQAEQAIATIFIKNLSFKTTQVKLEQEFSYLSGFRKATVMMKKKALKDGKTEDLSMGYGFLEFQSTAQAMEVIKKKQKCMIDGHAVQLQISQGKGKNKKDGAGAEEKRGGNVPVSNKLCVRNLAFEANKKELRALFASFGTVTALRLPKKPSGGHRGFAFLDFLTKQEALQAYESLQHTHFYGRHLVIEPAEKESETVEELRAKQVAMEDKKGTFSESKKRKRTAELETSGATGDGFEKMAL